MPLVIRIKLSRFYFNNCLSVCLSVWLSGCQLLSSASCALRSTRVLLTSTKMLNESKLPRPKTRPWPEPRGGGRGRGQLFKAEAKTKLKVEL